MEKINSYQKRIVSYEKIHSINEDDFKALVSIVNPKNGQSILDVCCGYGSVSKNILNEIDNSNLDTKLTLLDSSELQISRAKENLTGKGLDFILADARETPFEENTFDTVVNKMGLHEVPFIDQQKMLKEFFRILKPGGKMVIWELALDEKTQPIFIKFIKEKDRLSGFDSLVRNRHFPMKKEVLVNLESVGFEEVKVERDVYPNLSINNRSEELISADRIKILEEKGEISEEDNNYLEDLSFNKVNELKEFVRKNLSDEEKELMSFQDAEGDVKMKASKAIYSAFKPVV